MVLHPGCNHAGLEVVRVDDLQLHFFPISEAREVKLPLEGSRPASMLGSHGGNFTSSLRVGLKK